MTFEEKVVAYSRETIGTPYLHQGRMLGAGFDCIGVAIYVAHKLGLEYIDLPAYGATPHKGLLQRMVAEQPCLERIYTMEKGCLLVIEFIEGYPQHIGIFTGDSIIHCASNTGRVVEHYIDPATQGQITSMYRFMEKL